MAREIRGISNAGTLYARILNSSGLWWNGSSFEAYSAGNYGNYDIAMTEQGNSGVYVADFPTAIQTGGTYEYYVHRQLGASPAEGDPVVNTGKIDWTGTVSIAAASGSMSGSEFRDYLLRCGFKRTDKDTEVYEAITDAIQRLRRRFSFDEAEADTRTTDTISSLGDFKLNVESDFGLLISLILEDSTKSRTLQKISKELFDHLYPDINVTNNRGYPEHFTIYNGQIYIGPIPDATSYYYRKNYSKRAGTVTSSTAGVPFTNVYRDILADLVLSILYDRLEEYDKADRHRALFEDGYLEATRRENHNAGKTVFTVNPTNC